MCSGWRRMTEAQESSIELVAFGAIVGMKCHIVISASYESSGNTGIHRRVLLAPQWVLEEANNSYNPARSAGSKETSRAPLI